MSDSEDNSPLKGKPLPEDKIESLDEKPRQGQNLIDKAVQVMDDFRAGNKSQMWWAVFWLFVGLSIASRLYYITEPYKVVWDEAHFGKMVSWYINRTYFLDVHPVGGKLLLTLFGYLGGYNGSHSFVEPNAPYEGYDGIMPMRVGCALMGACLVPLCFHIVWTLTKSLPASAFAACLVTFEIGTITLSKFILLDPLLMCFIIASFHGLCLIKEVEDRQFTKAWWGAFAYTGVMLGCVLSVKFVGLFIILVVGCYTVLELFQMLGDLQKSLVNVLLHFLARALCLIALPAAIYVSIFFIHDQILTKVKTQFAGDEGIFSPQFQMRLEGNNINNLTQPREVAFGSVVTLKNANLGGIYLHSHNLSYPPALVGKNKLQVTGFSAKDENNAFQILFPEDDPDLPNGFYNGDPEYVMNGDWVRLYHLQSASLISCAKNKSLVTRKHNLIYSKPYNLLNYTIAAELAEMYDNEGENRKSNPNVTAWQLWQIFIEGGKPGEKLRPMDSKVKFLCVPINCALDWSTLKLPISWGGAQHEITCAANLMDPLTNWMVEQHINPYLPNKTYKHMESTFASRFVETHRIMTWVNSRLIPEGEAMFDSHRPWMWPVCVKSQVWFDVAFRIVLLGNPIIFWINLVFLFAVPAIIAYHYYRQKRGHKDEPEVRARKERLVFACKWLLLAYLFHYLPFYTMHRILYYHHYFPALQFSSMLTGFDDALGRHYIEIMTHKVRHLIKVMTHMCVIRLFFVPHHVYMYVMEYKAVVFGYLLESMETWLPRRKANLAVHWATIVFFAVVAYSFILYCHVGYGHVTDGPFNPDNSTYKDLRFFDDWLI